MQRQNSGDLHRHPRLNERVHVPKRGALFLIIVIMSLMTLACTLFEAASSTPKRIVMRNLLPTLTPTPHAAAPLAQPEEMVVPISVTPILEELRLVNTIDEPGEAVTGSNLIAPVATPVSDANDNSTNPAANVPPQTINSTSPALAANPSLVDQPTQALTFANVRTHSDPTGAGLLLYGDVINQSDTAQELNRVTGQFVDPQGQIIANPENISAYWPVELVPAKGRVPFELFAEGIQSVAKFDIKFEAQPSSRIPRQDFVLTQEYQDKDELGLCVGGILENRGAELEDFLVVVAVLYDAQNQMISFGDSSIEPSLATPGQANEFEVCADSFNQEVSRFELVSWGK